MRKLLIALGLLGGLALPMCAQSAISCTPSGDVCASVTVDRIGAVLRLDSFVPLKEPGVCVLPRRGPVRCVPLGPARLVGRAPAALHTATLRVPGPSLDLPPGDYLVQFGGSEALIGSPLRLGIPRRARANGARSLLTAPSKVVVGRQTSIVLNGMVGAGPLRVVLSPLTGGNCCGVTVSPLRRELGDGRVELRFTWPRSYFRCAGAGHCTRMPWGRRGRISVVIDEPPGDIVVGDVVIRRALAASPFAVDARPGVMPVEEPIS